MRLDAEGRSVRDAGTAVASRNRDRALTWEVIRDATTCNAGTALIVIAFAPRRLLLAGVPFGRRLVDKDLR